MKLICTACNGKRFTAALVKNMKGPSGNRYQSSIKPMKPANCICRSCMGTGKTESGREVHRIERASAEAVRQIRHEYAQHILGDES